MSTTPKIVWAGRILSLLPTLLFVFSGVMKFFPGPDSAQQLERIGVPESLMVTIAILELLSATLYAIPRTAVLGAILLTGYLGGAIMTHLRIGDPVFLHVAIGIVVWGGLYLRDPRVQALIPLRKI